MPSFRATHVVVTLGIILSLLVFNKRSSADGPSESLIAKLDCPDRVNTVALSPDGQLLAAGYGWNEEGGVRIWKVADHTVVQTWVAQKTENRSNDVDKVAFSPDGKLLAAATSAGDALVWKVGTWGEPKRIILRAGSPTALVFSPNSGVLALSSKSAVFLCDLRTWDSRKLGSLAGPAQQFIAAGFSGDGTKLAVCRDAAVQWWDVRTGQSLKSWKLTGLGFFCSLSSSRNYVVAGGGAIYGEKNVELWNASGRESLARLSEIRSGLFASATSHSDQWIALGGGDYGSGGDLSLWSLRDFHEIGFVSVGKFPIKGLAFSPDDSVLAAGSHDGVVFLFAVEKLRGPQRTKQKYRLCGEILAENEKVYIVPLAKVPTPMSKDFNYGWRLEVADPGNLAAHAGSPVAFQDWEIESNAAMDRARVNKFDSLLSLPRRQKAPFEYVVFGDVQNPGWDKGFVVKVYGEGNFVAANNSGECLAYGSLNTTTTANFDSLKTHLLREGLLSIPRDPLTRGLDHYRTRFIELSVAGGPQVRSDAAVVDFSKLRTHKTKKEEDFTRIFTQEEPFINSVLRSGMHPIR